MTRAGLSSDTCGTPHVNSLFTLGSQLEEEMSGKISHRSFLSLSYFCILLLLNKPEIDIVFTVMDSNILFFKCHLEVCLCVRVFYLCHVCIS